MKLRGTLRNISFKLRRKRKKTKSNNATYLVNVLGEDTESIRVDENTDLSSLSWNDEDGEKECRITSKPTLIDIDGEKYRIYFTRPGIQTTTSIHKDTLLRSDVYQADTVEVTGKDGQPVEVSDKMSGKVTGIEGSKQVLREVNKGKRMMKLLEPQTISKKKIIMYMGSGAAFGFIIAQWYIENGGF